MDITNKAYEKMANKKCPPSPILKDCIVAFLVGGAICTFGNLLSIF